MNLNLIPDILDATRKAKKNGHKFVPMFSGPAGIGKSEIIQNWAKNQGPSFGFIDLRAAYVEAPDLIGLVSIQNGRTTYNIPEFWPTTGEGIILLEEVNRANSSVMNALMQLLTDFKVLNYTVPEGWIIAAVINPEVDNDVNYMDIAFKNRFIEYVIEFDKKNFVEYIKKNNWYKPLISFIEKHWVYKYPSEIGTSGHYISPRTLSRLNTIHLHSNNETIITETIFSVFGNNYAGLYIEHLKNENFLNAEDFIHQREWAISKLKEMTLDKNFRGDVISKLLEDLLQLILNKKIELDFIKNLVDILPVDISSVFLIDLINKGLESSMIYELEEYIKKNWNYFKNIEKKKEMLLKNI